MTYVNFALAVPAAYLLGSVPFGLLIAKAHGKDLRAIGSGNIGATNVSRALGRKWAYVCFGLDVLKGSVPTLAAMFLATPLPSQSYTQKIIILWLWLALGHIFPVYVKFKGGKGVATSFGVALGLWPYYTGCALFALAIWTTVVLIWRYVSLASIVAAIAFPVALTSTIILTPHWHFADLWPLLVVAIAIPLMVTIRHGPNVRRIIAGTEGKIRQGRPKKNRNG